MFSFVLGIGQPPIEYRDVIRADFELYEKIHAGLHLRGIECELDGKEPWFLCEAHSEVDVDETLFALRDTLKELRQ